MIAHDPVRVCSSKIRSVQLAIGEQILRPRESSLKPGNVDSAGQTAVLSELPVVNGMRDIKANPSPTLHFDSAFRMSRSSCMISSASCICRSKSGS